MSDAVMLESGALARAHENGNYLQLEGTGVAPPYTDVLLEPFNNFTFAPWTSSGSIVAGGRTGNGAQFTSTSTFADFTIPSGNQADTLTMGFAWKATSFGLTTTPIADFRSDAGATIHSALYITNAGQITVNRGGTAIGTAAHGMTAGTFAYIEWQMKLQDATGTLIVRVNGAEKINFTGLDTKNAGTKTVYDTVHIGGHGSGVTAVFDDLYITTGAGAPFKGSITIP